MGSQGFPDPQTRKELRSGSCLSVEETTSLPVLSSSLTALKIPSEGTRDFCFLRKCLRSHSEITAHLIKYFTKSLTSHTKQLHGTF